MLFMALKIRHHAAGHSAITEIVKKQLPKWKNGLYDWQLNLVTRFNVDDILCCYNCVWSPLSHDNFTLAPRPSHTFCEIIPKRGTSAIFTPISCILNFPKSSHVATRTFFVRPFVEAHSRVRSLGSFGSSCMSFPILWCRLFLTSWVAHVDKLGRAWWISVGDIFNMKPWSSSSACRESDVGQLCQCPYIRL